MYKSTVRILLSLYVTTRATYTVWYLQCVHKYCSNILRVESRVREVSGGQLGAMLVGSMEIGSDSALPACGVRTFHAPPI